MLVIAALFLVVLGASVYGLRTAGGGSRWPFLVASTLSGGAILALVIATVIALTAGRDTWNSWVNGSQLSETATLWVVLIVGPVLLATAVRCSLSARSSAPGSGVAPGKHRHVDRYRFMLMRGFDDSVPPGGDSRRTSDPATWDDWPGSVRALASRINCRQIRAPHAD
jgi:hypothetical protein